MSDQELRSALQALAGAGEPPGSVADIVSAARRRRARRRATVAVGMAAAAAVVLSVLVWAPWADSPTPADPTDAGPTSAAGGRQAIAAGPLSPRDQAASAWIGSELIVVGGTTATCPDGGDCAGPTSDQLLMDGAAYDSEADSWRTIAAAPVPVLGFLSAVWTGSEMVVLTPSFQLAQTGEAIFTGELQALAYDPVGDSWRELPEPPQPGLSGGIWAGDRIMYWTADESAGEGDWSLDPSTGGWSRLPEDPLPPAFDRSYVWDGTQLVLAGLPNTDDGAGTFQLATLDLGTGTWTELPPSPVTFGGQQWFWFDGAVVNPMLAGSGGVTQTAGGALNLDTGDWQELPQLTDPAAAENACPLPAVGAAGDWLNGESGTLISLHPAVASLVPACGGQTPTAAAWTGTELVIWGGIVGSTPELTDTGWRWNPPSPGES